jgi:hypothetical protein
VPAFGGGMVAALAAGAAWSGAGRVAQRNAGTQTALTSFGPASVLLQGMGPLGRGRGAPAVASVLTSATSVSSAAARIGVSGGGDGGGGNSAISVAQVVGVGARGAGGQSMHLVPANTATASCVSGCATAPLQLQLPRSPGPFAAPADGVDVRRDGMAGLGLPAVTRSCHTQIVTVGPPSHQPVEAQAAPGGALHNARAGAGGGCGGAAVANAARDAQCTSGVGSSGDAASAAPAPRIQQVKLSLAERIRQVCVTFVVLACRTVIKTWPQAAAALWVLTLALSMSMMIWEVHYKLQRISILANQGNNGLGAAPLLQAVQGAFAATHTGAGCSLHAARYCRHKFWGSSRWLCHCYGGIACVRSTC